MATPKYLIFTTFFVGLIACRNNLTTETTDTPKTSKWTTAHLFPENSIGIAYLDTIIGDNYLLTVRFPNFTLPDSSLRRDTSNYTKDIIIDMPPQTITLFDNNGEITTLKNVTNCISKFWCENDGGTQYEPTYKLIIDIRDFKKTPKMQDKERLGKIACFAVVNYNPFQFKSFFPAAGTEDKNVVMRGRLSSDYSGYASTIQDSVYQYYDRNAQIILEQDDSGMADYCIMLQVFNSRQDYELGCCGP